MQMAWICLRWFSSFYHGKSPFLTTIWENVFFFFPAIFSANPSWSVHRRIQNYRKVESYTWFPQFALPDFLFTIKSMI